MNGRCLRRLAVTLLAGVAIALSVGAGAPLRAEDDPFPTEGDIGKVQKKIEAYRAWRITDELGLDERTNGRLLAILRDTDRSRIRLEAGNRELLRTLRQEMTIPAPDPRRVAAVLDRMEDNRQQIRQLEEEHMRRVREALPPVEAARFLLFDLRFQREIRERVFVAVKDRRMMMRRDEGDSPACAPTILPPGPRMQGRP